MAIEHVFVSNKRKSAVLLVTLAVALLPFCQAAFAADENYAPPDAKILAQVSSFAASFKAASPAKARKVLVYGISFGPHRFSIRTAQQVFKLLGEKTGAYEAVVSDDLANFEADKLKQFDAVIFANATGEVFCRPADKAQFNALNADDKRKQELNATRLAKNLDDYVRSGGGFMGIHSATDSLKSQKCYTDMIGAVFSQHPWGPNETAMIKVEAPENPLAAGVFKTDEFKFHDEVYEFREPLDRMQFHVILSLDLAKSDKPNRSLRRTDGDYPIAWTRSYGQGRVFYCSLGHAMTTFADPTILKFWLRGIQYAAGDMAMAKTSSRTSQP
jgi:type 1 glutamine amidotransferase